MKYNIVCKNCGTNFETPNKRHRVCPVCKSDKSGRTDVAMKKVEEVPTGFFLKSENEINKVVRKALENNMSYGRYVYLKSIGRI